MRLNEMDVLNVKIAVLEAVCYNAKSSCAAKVFVF
jgi:hypothetical protein